MSDSNDLLFYVGKRFLWAVPVLLGASFLSYILIHLAPGDPAQIILGRRATQEQLAQLRQEMALNKPVYVQYWRYLSDAAVGDLGRSYRSQQKVATMIAQRLPYTLQLAVGSLIVALGIGLPTGIYASLNRNEFGDHVSRIVALLGISIPNFWLGLMLILLIAVHVGAVPIYGMTLVTENVLAGVLSTLLPAVALGTALTALIMRMLRGSLLDEINKGYVQTANAYGIAEHEIMYVYVLKNGLLPTITVIGLQLGYLLGGSVVIETVFGIPGIGQMTLDAIFKQDFPVIQGVVLFVATVFVAVNILVDTLYAFLDPRIRLGGEST
jgi:peptide/nickel transport system permease protein